MLVEVGVRCPLSSCGFGKVLGWKGSVLSLSTIGTYSLAACVTSRVPLVSAERGDEASTDRMLNGRIDDEVGQCIAGRAETCMR